jgi:gamma-tubulin complex component 3
VQENETIPVYEDQTLPNLKRRLQGLAADFSARVVLLLGDLSYQTDADLRLLGVLLAFNEFYPVVHKRRTRERGTESGTVRRGVTLRTAVKSANGKEIDRGKPQGNGKDDTSSTVATTCQLLY